MTTPPIWALTGERGAGKTTLCRALAKQARLFGWEVAGLLSPAVFENGSKTGILTEDLCTGETQRLASVNRQSPEDLPFGKWYFDQQTLAWGNRILASSPTCDLLIVDELGPLELTLQMGWQAALEILPRGGYRVALVTIRPELQTTARLLFDFSEIIQISLTHTTDTWVGVCWRKMMGDQFDLPQMV